MRVTLQCVVYLSNATSFQNNPYFFSAPLAGLVTPATHEFIINFTSNQSTEIFISVDGPDDVHVWHPGQEKIPQNWYR
jgi:hypothetical protein